MLPFDTKKQKKKQDNKTSRLHSQIAAWNIKNKINEVTHSKVQELNFAVPVVNLFPVKSVDQIFRED